MTPEALVRIRELANLDYSVAHERVLDDSFAETVRLIDALRELVGAFDALQKEADSEPAEPSVHTDGGRPDFAAFVGALRGEAKWIADLWRRVDLTGHSRSDADRLEALAAKIEAFAKRLGYL